MSFKQADIESIECRHVVKLPMVPGKEKELHMVKEVIHFKDGNQKPNVRLISDFKQPFWTTVPGCQDHQEKKEWELLTRVKRWEARSCDLIRQASRALKQPTFRGSLKQLSRSPYLYGTDILSTAVIKQKYLDNIKKTTAATSASFDVETDVLHGTDEIIMATLAFKERVVTAVQAKFFNGWSDANRRTHEAVEENLGQLLKDRGVNWDFMIVPDEIGVLKYVFNRAHEWKPDFVSIWNINFDIKCVMAACEKANYPIADLLSDPKIPQDYRFFEYKEGPKQMVTAAGVVKPLKPAEQWHTAFVGASFYPIDAMCVYCRIRAAKGQLPSYSLDYVLGIELKMHKLHCHKASEEEGTLAWHREMQERYPFDYVAYNIFDCIGMELLEEQTNDLSIALPSQTGCSDYRHFKSQPRRTADALHYYVQTLGYVIGTTSDQMETELDQKTLGLRNWICTLPAHLVVDNGLNILSDYPGLKTNARAHIGDLDVSAAYPNAGVVFNVSKKTTVKEMCKVRGVSENVQRMEGINLSGGATNALEICQLLLKMPSMDQVLAAFNSDIRTGLV